MAAVINIALNLVFIPINGYLAASAITVITEAALCAFGWWFVQRRRPELRLPVLALSWRIVLACAVMGIVLYMLARVPDLPHSDCRRDRLPRSGVPPESGRTRGMGACAPRRPGTREEVNRAVIKR